MRKACSEARQKKLEDLHARSVVDRIHEARHVFATWYAEFGSEPIKLGDLFGSATCRLLTGGAYGAEEILYRLHAWRDRIEGGLKLVRTEDRRWRVLKVEEADSIDSFYPSTYSQNI